jgi:hypothetical protein
MPFTAADYGVTDPAILEAASHMAPALFVALRIAHTVDSTHFPIRTDADIERAFEAVIGQSKQFSHAGIGITAKSAKDGFPNALLPITDKLDLLRKVYQSILISHRKASRQAWEKVQGGSGKLTASHPVPTEVF